MDRIVLRRVLPDTCLDDALSAILSGTRAIIVANSESAVLVTAGEIMAECNCRSRLD